MMLLIDITKNTRYGEQFSEMLHDISFFLEMKINISIIKTGVFQRKNETM